PGAALVVAVDVSGVVVGDVAGAAGDVPGLLAPGERGVQAPVGVVADAVQVQVAPFARTPVGLVGAGGRRPGAAPGPCAVAVLGQLRYAVPRDAGAEAELEPARGRLPEPGVGESVDVDAFRVELYLIERLRPT